MSPKQALVIVPAAILGASVIAFFYCSKADEIAVAVMRYQTGYFYYLTLALPFVVLSGLALVGTSVLIAALVKKLR